MFKKRQQDGGVANLAFVETEGAAGKPKSNPNKISPLQIIEDRPPDSDDPSCGYFGVPCPAQRQCLSAVGILVFLCWASTIQVRV
jgi:hypothetical protein